MFKFIKLALPLLLLVACQRSELFDSSKIKIDDGTYPVVILGGGVAGLTAAIYLAQANIKCLVLNAPAKQSAITQSHSVRNWPGEENISGADLLDKLRRHAIASGAQIIDQPALNVNFSSWPYIVQTRRFDGSAELIDIKTLSCIISMGATSNFLNVSGEKEYWGKGISGCAVCDGPLYKDKVVGVVGGGDAAIEEAGYLSSLAKKVYIFVRRDKLRATGKVKDEIISKSNVEVLYNTRIIKINGDGKQITSVSFIDTKVEDKIGIKRESHSKLLEDSQRYFGREPMADVKQKKELQLNGLFLAIGSKPNTQMFKGKLELDANGYIVLKSERQTSKKGIYAVGDISEPIYKQAIIAAGQGCIAALQTQKFLRETGYDSAHSICPCISTLRDAGKPAPQGELVYRGRSSRVNFSKKNLYRGKIVEVSDKQELDSILNSDKPVVVDFYSTMCIPCQQMSGVLEDVATTWKDEVKFVKVNIRGARVLADEFDIQSVPTFVLVKNGQQVDKIVGASPQDHFVDKLKKVFKLEN